MMMKLLLCSVTALVLISSCSDKKVENGDEQFNQNSPLNEEVDEVEKLRKRYDK